jgi:hypothetical protein
MRSAFGWKGLNYRLIAGSTITRPKGENAKIEKQDTGIPPDKSYESFVSNLYVDAGARLRHDFGRISRYPRRED